MSDARTDPGGPDRPDTIVAAEYVLHLLEPEERAEVEQRLETSGIMRALVAEWAEYLVSLTDGIAEVAPPAQIRARLAELTSTGSREMPAETRHAPRRGFGFGQLVKGILGGLAVAAVAIVLAFVVGPEVVAPYRGPVYTAEIAGDDPQVFLVEARYNPGDNTLVLAREAGEAPAGRVLQLWLLPDGATSPVSLGLLPNDPEATFVLSDELGAGIPDGLMEISEEPPGGSPTGGPTGNVLGLGNVGEF